MDIAIIFGARSYEHEISIVSAIAMKKVLKSNLIYIFIDEDNQFYLIPSDTITTKIFSTKEYKKYDKLTITNKGFIKKTLFGTKNIAFDVVLNLVHGASGEDGELASLFSFFDIPFIGPRIDASVVSYDKYITKTYATSCGVDVLVAQYFHKNQTINIDEFPVIIKPTKLGSSIGVSVVKSKNELQYALDVAFEYDDTIIVEPFIENIKEYNLAGCKIDGDIVFSIIEEPQKDQFLDFDKKYLDFNRTSEVVEAKISEELKISLKENFKKIYNSIFDGALIRCDFFVIDNKVYLNEINPIPGSMANYLFDDFSNLIEKLSKNLPQKRKINIDYKYVNQIHSAKGKL